MTWTTRLTKRFPCTIPVIGAPMAGVSGGLLAAETCRAGALGFIAAGHITQEADIVGDLKREIELFRSKTTDQQQPLSLGFIGHSTFATDAGWERLEQVLQTHKPAVVQFFAPAVIQRIDCQKESIDDNIALAQSYSAKVLTQVGSYREAVTALQAGADGLIVQGSEAGGHGLRRELGNGTLSLARQVVKLAAPYDVPVVAAGGIVDGQGLAAVLAAGCDGAVLGTRLWASQEAMGKEAYKQRLVETESCDQVTRTTVFDQIQNSYSKTPWPRPFDSVGALRNETSREWDGRPDELAAAMNDGQLIEKYRQAQKDANADIALIHSGEGVGMIDAVEPAYDIVTRINQEALETIRNLSKLARG